MLATYSAAALIYAASLLAGAAIVKACGRDSFSGFGPPAGLAALIVLSATALRLPGDATSAVVVLVVALVAALAYLRRDALRAPPLELVVAGAAALLATAIPFLVAGRVGILGVGINNDLATHVAWVHSLITGIDNEPLRFGPGYPLGPHALVAAVAEALGVSPDEAFTGLLLAIPLVALSSALPLLADLPRWRRALAAWLVALCYLMAAYYGQGAFKETLQAVFVVMFVALLWEAARDRALGLGTAVLMALALGGGFFNYSYLGLGWAVAAVGAWVVLELLFGGGRLRPARVVSRIRAWFTPRRGAAAALVLLVLAVPLAPELSRARDFFDAVSFSPSSTGAITQENVGNLTANLPPVESVGVFPLDDFRSYWREPRDAYRAGLLGAIGIAAALFALVWWLRRRDFAVPAAVAGAAAIYLVLRAGGESPYVIAKALAVGAPLLMLMIVRPLLGDEHGGLRSVRGVLAALFVLAAVASSLAALRGSFVGSEAHADDLAPLREPLAGRQTLYIGNDLFVQYRLRGVPVTDPYSRARLGLKLRPGEGAPAAALDFDSFDAATLDQFAYVIVPRTRFQSEPPVNFRLDRRTRFYEVWRRSGRTPARLTLRDGAAPGKRLDCGRPAGRRLSRLSGWARVRPEPVLAFGPEGTLPLGSRVRVQPGDSAPRTLLLGDGRWELSLAYTSVRDGRLRARGVDVPLPAQSHAPGPSWRVGEAGGGGRALSLTVSVDSAPFGAGEQVLELGTLSAVPVDEPARLVPLSRACGRYVDWYTLGPRRPALPSGRRS